MLNVEIERREYLVWFDFEKVEIDPTRLYHGIHFAKYSGKRTDFAGKTGPGPGEYDPNDPVKLEIHHINMKTWDKRPELQVARYPENLLRSVTKEVSELN